MSSVVRPAHRARSCPHCRASLADAGDCPACRGHWSPGAELDALAPGKLAAWRRLAGKGPVAHESCADCGGALKSLDVPGHQHEGDLFWGLESARPSGTAVVEACPRCGGTFATEANVARAGGLAALRDGVARVMLQAS